MDAKKSAQAHDLADAFHNLPLQIFSDRFSIPWFLKCLQGYQEKYRASLTFDYVGEWNKLITATP